MFRDGYYKFIELKTEVMRSNAKSLLNHIRLDRYSEDLSTVLYLVEGWLFLGACSVK